MYIYSCERRQGNRFIEEWGISSWNGRPHFSYGLNFWRVCARVYRQSGYLIIKLLVEGRNAVIT